MGVFLKKMNDFLAGLPMTIIAGVMLLISFVFPRMGISLPFDTAWAAVFITGIPMFYLAIWRVIHLKGISKISSALLIAIAMLASIIIGDMFAAGEVGFIMSLGALLEEFTTDRAKSGLKKLISLAPTMARRVNDAMEEMIPYGEIKENDLLRVLAGETIPADGIIVCGQTSVDQSIMTGESLPVDKGAGDSVFCGTINRFGSVDIRATEVGEDSSLSKLIRLVAEAENKKAPMQRIADRVASYLVPVALFIALVAWAVTGDFVRCVTVMVVFCPCALVLATPTAIMAAIGQATKHGVIIKSGEALERMGKVNVIAFDKTGTLTEGKLSVSDIIPVKDISQEELFVLAAAAESRSEHPLGKAIFAEAKKRELDIPDCTEFTMEPGKGVSAVVNGKHILCGNDKHLNEEVCIKSADRLMREGKAIVLVKEDEELAGLIALSDTLRESSQKVIKALNDMNTETVLLTGDHKVAAEYFAGKLGITRVLSDLLPAEKVSNIEALEKEKGSVCMVGDGVNDAPAMKLASVGVAMAGMGADIAVEAAQIALMNDDISKLPYLKRLANETIKTIRISIALSMTINIIAVILSVTGILTPTTGALVHNCGSCFVVGISALLYDRKLD